MGQALGFYQVDQSTVAVKEHFGKFDDVLEPGCHWLPWYIGYQLAGTLSLRVKQLDVRCETKTKDNVFVTVVASVQYRALANQAADAFSKLSNTKEQIQAYVFDVIRASVPKLDLDSAFEQKNDIAKAVENELEKAMSAYGFEIVQTLIVDIEPDAQVKRANPLSQKEVLYLMNLLWHFSEWRLEKLIVQEKCQSPNPLTFKIQYYYAIFSTLNIVETAYETTPPKNSTQA